MPDKFVFEGWDLRHAFICLLNSEKGQADSLCI